MGDAGTMREGMRSRTRARVASYGVEGGVSAVAEGKAPPVGASAGMSRHGENPDTSLLVGSIFHFPSMRWEAGPLLEHKQGKSGLQI